jgi:hypothetical protein
MFKASVANFLAEFWAGFEQEELDATPFFANEQVKASVSTIIAKAFEVGMSTEKARVSAILTAPGAATFPEIAMDLVRGPATCEQAMQVLERAEADAATRAATIKSNLLESSNASTIH